MYCKLTKMSQNASHALASLNVFHLKQSSVVSLWLMATVNTWKCKRKHNNVNHHLHSWFYDFSLRKKSVLH